MPEQRIVFVSMTVSDPTLVPHWGYFRAEPAAQWVAAAVEEGEWKPFVIDADQLSDAAVLEQVAQLDPAIVGFSCYASGMPRALRIAETLKSQRPTVITVFGGWHPSLDPDAVLREPCVDVVGVGQGERFINDLLRTPSAFIGQIIRAKEFPSIERPRPIRRLGEQFASFHFFGVPPLRKQRSASIVISGGGCAFKCSYCCTPAVNGKLERPHTVERVLSEIEELVEVHGVNFIFIRDENPALYKSLLSDLCRALIDRGLNRRTRFYSFGDTRLMTDDLLHLMAEAGWIGLNYGVEAFDPTQLRILHRSPNLAQIDDVFRWTRAAGIFATANVIVWKAGDNLDIFSNTLRALRSLQPDEVMVLFSVPFPGTEDARRYASYRRRTVDLADYHLLTPVLELDASVSTQELIMRRRTMLDAYYRSSEYANLIAFRKDQFGTAFAELTEVRRNRMLAHGVDIWALATDHHRSTDEQQACELSHGSV